MFKVMARKCDECLLSPRKIVSDERRREILRQTAREDCHFVCHKATIAGQEVACRGHYETTGGGRLARFAAYVGAIQEIDPETLEPVGGEGATDAG